MSSKTFAPAIGIPLSGLNYLYRTEDNKKVVCEIDIEALKTINDPATIEEMVAEARLEYMAGKTKGFSDSDALLSHLNS